MQKSKLLLTILAICIIIGSIPCVMSQSNASEPPMMDQSNASEPPMPEITEEANVTAEESSAAAISAEEIMTAEATIAANTWYYGKISYVYPWMGSDYIQVGLKTSTGTTNFRVQPAGTNNQYLHTELVNSLVTAHQTNHYIYVYTDQNGYIQGTYTTTNV